MNILVNQKKDTQLETNNIIQINKLNIHKFSKIFNIKTITMDSNLLWFAHIENNKKALYCLKNLEHKKKIKFNILELSINFSNFEPDDIFESIQIIINNKIKPIIKNNIICIWNKLIFNINTDSEECTELNKIDLYLHTFIKYNYDSIYFFD